MIMECVPPDGGVAVTKTRPDGSVSHNLIRAGLTAR